MLTDVENLALCSLLASGVFPRTELSLPSLATWNSKCYWLDFIIHLLCVLNQVFWSQFREIFQWRQIATFMRRTLAFDIRWEGRICQSPQLKFPFKTILSLLCRLRCYYNLSSKEHSSSELRQLFRNSIINQ